MTPGKTGYARERSYRLNTADPGSIPGRSTVKRMKKLNILTWAGTWAPRLVRHGTQAWVLVGSTEECKGIAARVAVRYKTAHAAQES